MAEIIGIAGDLQAIAETQFALRVAADLATGEANQLQTYADRREVHQ